jgi:hypothetical protein
MKNSMNLFTVKRNNKFLVMCFILASAALSVTACEKGPAEKAGKNIDQGIENMQDSYNEGVEEVKNEIDDHS